MRLHLTILKEKIVQSLPAIITWMAVATLDLLYGFSQEWLFVVITLHLVFILTMVLLEPVIPARNPGVINYLKLGVML